MVPVRAKGSANPSGAVRRGGHHRFAGFCGILHHPFQRHVVVRGRVNDLVPGPAAEIVTPVIPDHDQRWWTWSGNLQRMVAVAQGVNEKLPQVLLVVAGAGRCAAMNAPVTSTFLAFVPASLMGMALVRSSGSTMKP